MKKHIENKLHLYQVTVIFSLMFALAGFSYNVWRMEVTEDNSNIRTACFEILIQLSSLEQLVYTAHYDNNLQDASPRKGWVTVGLIENLSVLTSDSVESEAAALKAIWSDHWRTMPNSRKSADNIVNAIDAVRDEIKRVLISLD